MATNEAAQTLWRAYARPSRPQACRRCLAGTSRAQLSRSISRCSGPQLASQHRREVFSRRNGAPRSFSTLLQPQKPGKEIAVLGGGITGLTTAYYLTRFYPTAKITIYESNARLGGWADTEKVQVRSEGKDETVVFERGPRTVAPQTQVPKWDDFVLWELIQNLNLDEEVYRMPKDPGPMMRRYIYFPDHLVDVTAPVMDPQNLMGMLTSWLGAASNVLTEPLYTGMIPSLIQMLRTPPSHKTRRPGEAVQYFDISIGDYFQGKMGRPDVVNNLLSALIHGIYGGDVWKLSMESSIFRRMLIRDQVGLGSIPNADMFVERQDINLLHDVLGRDRHLYYTGMASRNWSFLGFYNGFSTLTIALEKSLRSNPLVTIKTGEPVTAVKYDEKSRKVEIQSSKSNGSKQYEQVISTLFSGTLGKITGDKLPTLKQQKAATIQVVNLWYPTPNLNTPHSGFGYLIPGSVPAANNPHAALGVLFDSDREFIRGAPKDPAVQNRGRMDTVPGTKLTVMLGGHHWDWLPEENWPDAQEAAEMAKATVQRQLGLPDSVQKDVVASTKICRECIPQQYVGHTNRMFVAHDELLAAFHGKLTVAGGSYTAPGVLPSLRAGRDVAQHVAGHGYMNKRDNTTYPLSHVGETGLGWAALPGPDLVPSLKAEVPFRYGNDTR